MKYFFNIRFFLLLITMLFINSMNAQTKNACENAEAKTYRITAIDYYNSNDYDNAFYYFQKAVDLNCGDAMAWMGYMYEHGLGVETNFYKAFDLYKRGAEVGSTKCKYNLAVFYRDGMGTSRNLKNAKYWFENASWDGDYGAMSDLGICYIRGEGTNKSISDAKYWFEKSCNGGNENGCDNLRKFNERY